MVVKKFCPRCGSTNIIMVAGGEIGMWECVDCSYRGSILPEKEIVGRELNVKKVKKQRFFAGNKK